MESTFAISGTAEIDPKSESYCEPVQNYFQNKGMRLVEIRNSKYFISFNHNKKSYREFIDSGGEAKNSVLVRLEPDAVFPAQFRKNINSKYGLIYTPGSTKLSGREQFLPWPYNYVADPSHPTSSELTTLSDLLASNAFKERFTNASWQQKINKIVLIAANKVSPRHTSNYSQRRLFARKISSDLMHIYGPLWKGRLNEKIMHRLAVSFFSLKSGVLPNPISIYGGLHQKYKSALGKIGNKHEILNKYRFSLVIENSNDYVSEKLIDVLISGAIPIYIGPSLVLANFPDKIAIQINHSEINRVNQILENIDDVEIRDIQETIYKFLTSENFLNKWKSENVYNRISSEIYTHWSQV